MTICYGVTTMGAREQVEKQLIDKHGKEYDFGQIRQFSGFISSIILSVVDNIFEKAMKLKKW